MVTYYIISLVLEKHNCYDQPSLSSAKLQQLSMQYYQNSLNIS